MEDNKIIELYVQRSEDAIKETQNKYNSYCETIANNIVGNMSDTQECVNDTYFKLWNTIPPTIPQIFKAYIAKIVRNFALKKYRDDRCAKRGNGEVNIIIDEIQEFIPVADNVDTIVESKIVLEVITRVLENTSNENRIIFVRRYWYADSIHSISKMYDMSESKVKSILFRVRNKLKEELIKEDIYI